MVGRIYYLQATSRPSSAALYRPPRTTRAHPQQTDLIARSFRRQVVVESPRVGVKVFFLDFNSDSRTSNFLNETNLAHGWLSGHRRSTARAACDCSLSQRKKIAEYGRENLERRGRAACCRAAQAAHLRRGHDGVWTARSGGNGTHYINHSASPTLCVDPARPHTLLRLRDIHPAKKSRGLRINASPDTKAAHARKIAGERL